MEVKLEIGRIVFLKAVGNNARYNKEVRIEEFEIKRVGRKYFEVGKAGSNNPRFFIKFSIDELKEVTNYAADWIFYFSRQDVLDEQEAEKLTDEIRKVFNPHGQVDLTLEQLRKIKDIIG